MFEPLNALEQQLMSAARDPAERPRFQQMLLEHTLYISPAGADGSDDQVVVSHQPQGDLTCVFTAAERVTQVVGPTARVKGAPGREVLERVRRQGAHLNPNLEYGVVFSPRDLDAILDGVSQEVVAKDEPLLLAHPAEPPTALIAALGAELSRMTQVKGAWLMLAHRASDPSQSWMVGVDASGPWDPVSQAIGRVTAVADLGGRALFATPLQDDSLARTLRGGIPIIAAAANAAPAKKRGLFDFLKR